MKIRQTGKQVLSEKKPKIVAVDTEAEFAETAAKHFLSVIATTDKPLVTLPSGNTALGMYHYLVEHYAGRLDIWGDLRYISLDEYLGLPDDDYKLFHRWIGRELLNPAGVPPGNRVFFDSAAADPVQEGARIENWLAVNGPLDLAVLGLGANGHMGFNEPGSAFDSRIRPVTLSSQTIASNAAYWGLVPEETPHKAITLGLANLAEARQILLLVSGAHKADILDRVLNGPVTEDVPASLLQTLGNVTVIADRAALGET